LVPETGYAKTADGVHIAYQVFGEGRVDLVLASWALNIDALWGWEPHADALRRLASFARCSRWTAREPDRLSPRFLSAHEPLTQPRSWSPEKRPDAVDAAFDAL
jgi:hypothetical protein